MRLIRALRQRIADWRLERSIGQWRRLAQRAQADRCPNLARAAYEQMAHECRRRSPQQIARMEARLRG